VTIEKPPLPDNALLRRYCRQGAYTDCYSTWLDSDVSLADYVDAFYTTPIFRLERWILDKAASKPSTDRQVAELAAGTRDTFAAWRVEAREHDQLMLCDYRERTRSWLMIDPEGSESGTRLYFGSAVVFASPAKSREARRGVAYRALLLFHRIYSRVLIYGARRRLIGRVATSGY
jgi:hypothetical protein